LAQKNTTTVKLAIMEDIYSNNIYLFQILHNLSYSVRQNNIRPNLCP